MTLLARPHAPSRRASLAALVQGLALAAGRGGVPPVVAALGACALPSPPGTLPQPLAGQWQALAPGLGWIPGAWGDVDVGNQGRVGNVAVLLGPQASIVLNAGVSWAHGRALKTTIEAATGRPVGLLLLTQVRQEFVLGACAFQEAGIPVAMHPAAARLMAARCGTCRKRLAEQLGAEAMDGTRLITPDLVADPTDPSFTARLSALAGRPLRLLAAGPGGHSSGPGDLALWDATWQTLLALGWVDIAVVPDTQDARPDGWREALAIARQLRPQRVLPGHGPVGGPAALADVQRYLDELDGETHRLLRAGVPLSEVADQVQLPAFRHWVQYDSVHRRNASISFLRQERAQLMRDEPAAP